LGTPTDKALFYTAVVMAALTGAASPAFSFAFGSMIDSAG